MNTQQIALIILQTTFTFEGYIFNQQCFILASGKFSFQSHTWTIRK